MLMAQNNSLIYYGISVNDVVAYFLTGLKTNLITPTNPTTQQPFGQFPTTANDLAQITAFASEHAVTTPIPMRLQSRSKPPGSKSSPATNHCNNKAFSAWPRPEQIRDDGR